MGTFELRFMRTRGTAKIHQKFHGVFHGDFHARFQEKITRQHFARFAETFASDRFSILWMATPISNLEPFVVGEQCCRRKKGFFSEKGGGN